MKSETVHNELERLQKDKQILDQRISQFREELIQMEKNRDMLIGAIQTCSYLLKQDEEDSSEETTE